MIAYDLARCSRCRILPDREWVTFSDGPHETIRCPICHRCIQQKVGTNPSAATLWNRFQDSPMIRRIAPLLLASLTALALCSCAAPVTLDVDVSRQQMTVRRGGQVVRRIPVETSRIGTGSRLGSHRTPLGEFTLRKEPGHRFGPIFRLDGYQGDSRGILIHRDLTAGHGTNGCIATPDWQTQQWLFARVDDGASLLIHR